MSILILTGIVSAASTLGIITLQNLRQANDIDFSLTAFYAAESGVEDGLYDIRRGEAALASLSLNGVLSNDSSWQRTILGTQEFLTKERIAQNDFWQIDLYDPDVSLSPLFNAVKSLQIDWQGGGAEWLEVEYSPWFADGALGNPVSTLFNAQSKPAIVNLQDANNVLYRVRIKSLYAEITDITVRAYNKLNAGGAQIDIPAQVTLLSTGQYGRTAQAVRATMPQRTPLSGAFSYVIFTEEDLLK